jgi:hypothetical protein
MYSGTGNTISVFATGFATVFFTGLCAGFVTCFTIIVSYLTFDFGEVFCA